LISKTQQGEHKKQYEIRVNSLSHDVINIPSSYKLDTTSQIQNMAIGDLVLTRDGNGQFVLNYDIEQSSDLQSWLPYQSLALPLTNLPSDKAFIRFKVKQ